MKIDDATLLALSRGIILAHYEHRDIETVMRFMVEDVSWIGPMECQRASSAAEMRAILEPEYATRVKVIDEVWGVRCVAGAHIAVGMFGIFVPDSPAKRVVFRQSATFVWAILPDGPHVVHLHLSNAYDVPSMINRQALIGENAIEYAVEMASAAKMAACKRLRFQATDGIHFLSENSILYAEAKGKACRIVHDDGSFVAAERLSSVRKRLGFPFIPVHRSYAVNARRVRGVRRFEVELDSGARCPIAERRYLNVVNSLKGAEVSCRI